MFEIFYNFLSGGASAVESGRQLEDNGWNGLGRLSGFDTAANARRYAGHGNDLTAAYLFGFAGEREGRHNHHWFW